MLCFNKTIVQLYEQPCRIKKDPEHNREFYAVSDEGLYGMPVRLTEEEYDADLKTDGENEFVKVITYYSYPGWVRKCDLSDVQIEYPLMVVNAAWTDVMSLPSVHGIPLQYMTRGCLVQVTGEKDHGYCRVKLLDGRLGWIPEKYLSQRLFPIDSFDTNGTAPDSERFSEYLKKLIDENYNGSEEVFRKAVTDTAGSYMGTQYRWSGKSPLGIDCSGLTFMSYMMNGVLIYRDGRIVDGFPVRRIARDEIKQADLLYFPGHVALYIGDGYYIHSTARTGSNGVDINSLNSSDPVYRKDLDEIMYAAGTIFG